MTIEDRGNAVSAMRSSTSCGRVMRSSAALATSPLSIVTAVQRRPLSVRATAVNTCVPIGFSGARIGTGTSMVASNRSPPPGRPGGVVLLGLGRVGGVLGRRGSVELGLRVGLGGVEPRLQFLDFRSGLLLLVLGSCLGLVGLGGGERPLCDRERGIGASLGQFKLAQRRRERCRLLHRKGGSVLRLLS